MRRIFALAMVVVLLAVVVAPQVQAVSWKTYKDAHGRFSMQYPAGWIYANVGVIAFDVSMGQKGGDICCLITVSENSGNMPGKFKDRKDMKEGETTREVLIAGKKYVVGLVFGAPSSDFDSGNKTYFEPMIKSLKVK